ncbi:hypothetical protein ACE1SV_65210 [Streptomyces sp. E-15]
MSLGDGRSAPAPPDVTQALKGQGHDGTGPRTEERVDELTERRKTTRLDGAPPPPLPRPAPADFAQETLDFG